MVTRCHSCNRILIETKERFLLCKLCNRFTPTYSVKNNNVFKLKKVKKTNKMEATMDSKIQKRGHQKKTILELLGGGSTVDEIVTETGFRKARVVFVKKKFFKVE